MAANPIFTEIFASLPMVPSPTTDESCAEEGHGRLEVGPGLDVLDPIAVTLRINRMQQDLREIRQQMDRIANALQPFVLLADEILDLPKKLDADMLELTNRIAGVSARCPI